MTWVCKRDPSRCAIRVGDRCGAGEPPLPRCLLVEEDAASAAERICREAIEQEGQG